MKSWLVSPRDPLIFRDGKPFTAAPGSRAETLHMPFPSTLAGAIRTMAGRDQSTGQFDTSRIDGLLQKNILGPFLVELKPDDQVFDHLLPAPADALLFTTDEDGKADRYALRPLAVEGAKFNDESFSICGPSQVVRDKPLPRSKTPSFWRWDEYCNWLKKGNPPVDKINLSAVGINRLPEESRTHVGVDPESQVAIDGALFQTTGLSFDMIPRIENEPFRLKGAKRFGLKVLTDADTPPGIVYLGGERRFARWTEIDGDETPFQNCPDKIRKKIYDYGYCRLVLITPAYFEKGNHPTWLKDTFGIEVVAVINQRYQGLSGWDYHLRSPKPTRRLTPAGSIFFLKLPDDKEKREHFVQSVWMETISDDDQARRDGFGIALLGVWDGHPVEIEMERQS